MAISKITSLGTARTFLKVGSCSEALMNVLDRAFDHPMENEERSVMPLAGGIARQGYQCGMLWGAALAAGGEAYRRYGAGAEGQTAALVTTQRLVDAFQEHTHHINCLEVSGTDWKKKYALLKNFLKGGPVVCMRLSGAYAKTALKVIETTLSSKNVFLSCGSCSESCTKKLIEKVGLSDMHAVMATGFAGGLGLSGGGCGALSTAIWINEIMRGESDETEKETISRSEAMVGAFLKHTDYEIECAEIVGKKFESVTAHGDYVHRGGCAAIIDTLASMIERNKGTAETAAADTTYRATGA